MGVRQLLRRPVLVPLALLVALSALVAAPVAAALVAGRPGRLLHDGVHALTRDLGSRLVGERLGKNWVRSTILFRTLRVMKTMECYRREQNGISPLVMRF